MGAKSSKSFQKFYTQEIYCPFESIKTNGKNPTSKLQAPKNFSPEKGGSESEVSLTQKSITNIYIPQPNAFRVQQGIENYPACSIGFVQSWFGGGFVSNGSGFMIHRNLVMTCAHHIYNLQINSIAKEVDFCLGRFKNQGKKVKVLKIYYPQEYLEAKDPKTRFLWDFGILQLAEDVDQQFGYLGLSFDGLDIGKNSPKSIYGYPYNLQQIQLCKYEGQCTLQEGIIKHNFPTQTGVDGGPIIYQTSKQARVIGIHQGNYVKDGRAIKLRLEIYQKMRFWLSQKRGSLDLSNLVYILRQNGCLAKKAKSSQIKTGRAQLQLIQVALQKLRQKQFGFQRSHYDSEGQLDQFNESEHMQSQFDSAENSLGNSGLKVLSQGLWPRLNTLNLSFTCISSEGLQYLRNSVWKSLEGLYLCISLLDAAENNIMALGVKALVQCDWKHLKELSLSGNNIGTKGSMELSKSNWKNLQKLLLQRCFLESEGLYWLTKADWKRLKCLNIAQNNIGDHGIKLLLDSRWVFLQALTIDQNKVSTEGFTAICQINWKCLKYLSARQNNIDGAGFIWIIRTDWKRLESLDVRWNAVVQEDITTLKQAFQAKLARLKNLDL